MGLSIYVAGFLTVLGILTTTEKNLKWHELLFCPLSSWFGVGIILGEIYLSVKKENNSNDKL